MEKFESGWICPRCGKVNASFLKWCDCTPANNIKKPQSATVFPMNKAQIPTLYKDSMLKNALNSSELTNNGMGVTDSKNFVGKAYAHY